MALKEQDIVFTTTDEAGNPVIQFPITRVENVEDAVRTVNKKKPDSNGDIQIDVDMSHLATKDELTKGLANKRDHTIQIANADLNTLLEDKTWACSGTLKNTPIACTFCIVQAYDTGAPVSGNIVQVCYVPNLTDNTVRTFWRNCNNGVTFGKWSESGAVKTVNSIAPDASGEVTLPNATTSKAGLVRLAAEEDVLNEAPQTAVCTQLIYEINEFRRKSTAYQVGDKVDCAFQYERFLECTKAGKTSAELLDTRNVTHGHVIADGMVEWTVRTHVRSVNGNVAGADGNVLVDVGVKTVNGNGPDGSGNVKVDTGLPLGHLFAWPYQTPPDGAIQCNGATYNRALYKDFFAYATSKGWVKTETEWQSIASANGGYCPYYSQGDGSTTFRTPKFAPFMQVAIASGDVGKYHKAGLPNITGRSDLGGIYSHAAFSGAIATEKNAGNATGATHVAAGGDQRVKLTFDASNSNSIYGRSSTVQPESHEWMICVVVAGQATNLGSVDMADVLTTVAQVQTELGTAVKSVNGQKPNNAGNVTIEVKSAMPNYSSYVQVSKGDFTPTYDGWIRLFLSSSSDYRSFTVKHKESDQVILNYAQARYPGSGWFMCPLVAGETYTISSSESAIYFHPMR